MVIQLLHKQIVLITINKWPMNQSPDELQNRWGYLLYVCIMYCRQAKAIGLPSCVIVLRVLRDLCRRSTLLSVLSLWVSSVKIILFLITSVSLFVCLCVSNENMLGDHLSGKPGNVRDFDSCQGNVRDFTKSQGSVEEKILSRKSGLKLFIVSYICTCF